MQKILFIIIDGLGDNPISQLGNKTPLEAAKTPNFNWLAKNGITGVVAPFVEKGKLPTSEDTHLSLFGYSPRVYNPGRGVLEVLGIGMKILKGDVCLRGNFATVNKNLKIIDRRAERIEATADLVKAISGIEVEGIKFLVKKAVSHRIGIVMRGSNLSSSISDGDPKIAGVKPLEILPKEQNRNAIFTARALNQFLKKCHLILKGHPSNKKRKKPANYVLVRGAGVFREIPSFFKKYRRNSCCIAGGSLYKGIGKFLGMDIIKTRGANALPTTNLRAKFLAAERALGKYNFVFCHIKAADNLAEDGDFRGKKKFIEKIDKNLTPILKLKNTLIVVTADHSTCCNLKKHCLAKIPLLVYSKNMAGAENGKKAEKFSERSCHTGKLGDIRQLELMRTIFRIVNSEQDARYIGRTPAISKNFN